MYFANSTADLLLALAPSAIMIALGCILSFSRTARGAISATLLATGFALLVLFALIVGTHTLEWLGGLHDSEALLIGLPLATFAGVLGMLARRDRLSALRVGACGTVGLFGLWWLGGFVAILAACTISPSGGC
jgi:hypothetical protein